MNILPKTSTGKIQKFKLRELAIAPFAPAIAAVQQKGVRVEVISFRGNTSSDLIDVADVFIDITNVAKVEAYSR